PKMKIVILSMHSNAPYVLEALRNGASAYVLKSSGAEELIHAIHSVMNGIQFISQQFPKEMISNYIEKTKETLIDPFETLTRREREVLTLAAQGLSLSKIANTLFISQTTAMTHRANLMRKLGLHNQTDLVRFSVKRGIVDIYD
ncbi:MAG: response regulator transcription factor, partial [Methylococcaceae bacterium]